MTVASPQNQSVYQTLNLGSFPQNVLEFQDHDKYLHQVIFVDHQLQSTLLRVSAQDLFITASEENSHDVIRQLIQYMNTLNARNASVNKSYLEVYYASVVLAHLHILIRDFESAIATLNDFRIDHSVFFESSIEYEFLDYLSARFHCLLGQASQDRIAVWSVFLTSLKRYGHTSQVAANIWIDSIVGNMITSLSRDGESAMKFADIRKLAFANNLCSLVLIANHSLRQEFTKCIHSSFKSDYKIYLSELIKDKMKSRKEFPDASEENPSDIDFVQTLYQSLDKISTHKSAKLHLLKAKTSKEFLISTTERSYQSQAVLSNLIVALLDLGEYDEAIAAFKTYVSYIEKEKIQLGVVPDLLQVIKIYALCITSFNPLNSFIQDAKSHSKRFKYNSLDIVTSDVTNFAKSLEGYLAQLATSANLVYDDKCNDQQEYLSFLYHRYNSHANLGKDSVLFVISSNAWYSLGRLYQYFCTYGSADAEALERNEKQILLHYKNALIAKPGGSSDILFDYALALANEQFLRESFTLCKFILRKHPESFRTWNLLSLLASAFENEKSLNKDIMPELSIEGPVHEPHSEERLDLPMSGKSNISHESEKFIGDALNIASILLKRNHDLERTVSFEIKHEILQLKLTQLAIREAKNGVSSILELIPEVFRLYGELFSGSLTIGFDASKISETNNDTKSTNRPSVADVSRSGRNAVESRRRPSEDSIQKLSRLSLASLERTQNVKHGAEGAVTPEREREQKLLQEVWLWTASLYLKTGLLEEAEQCIVEAESAFKPNTKTYTYLGLLTSGHRKRLALQEFERSFEVFHSAEEEFNKRSYGLILIGLGQLLLDEKEGTESLFTSEKDRDAGLVRLKNYLESHVNCWPYGRNCPEVWHFLSMVYEKFDDKLLQADALWRCVDLEAVRPVRSYEICEEFVM